MPAKQTGFTLLEVLVTIIIVSIGLLGILKLQSVALIGTQISEARSWATIAADSMADRMRANAKGAADRGYVDAAFTKPAGQPNKQCVDVFCEPDDMAQFDIWEWRRTLQQTLPDGKGSIECMKPDAGPCEQYQIRIAWHERARGDAVSPTPADSCGNDSAPAERCFQTVVRP